MPSVSPDNEVSHPPERDMNNLAHKVFGDGDTSVSVFLCPERIAYICSVSVDMGFSMTGQEIECETLDAAMTKYNAITSEGDAFDAVCCDID